MFVSIIAEGAESDNSEIAGCEHSLIQAVELAYWDILWVSRSFWVRD